MSTTEEHDDHAGDTRAPGHLPRDATPPELRRDECGTPTENTGGAAVPDVGVVISSRPLVSLQRRDSQPLLELGDFFQEQIEQWCANYRRARPNVDASFNYDTLRKRGLAEVAQTPIVLYMIALLYEDDSLTREHYTRTDIFRTFIDWTESGGYARRGKGERPIRDQQPSGEPGVVHAEVQRAAADLDPLRNPRRQRQRRVDGRGGPFVGHGQDR